MRGSRAAGDLPRWAAVPAVGVLVLLYLLLAVHPFNRAYLDYVDGYYLYAAQRMAQGAVLYRQVMGVQPPGIYLVGDVLFRLHDSLAAARCYAALLHVVLVLLVYLAGQRLTGTRTGAVLAALLYSVAPYSLVWSRLFDPNPLVTCLTLASFLALLSGSRRGATAAGLLGAAALAVKIWYLPVGAVCLIFLWLHRRDLLASFVGALLGGVALTLAAGSALAGAAFWQGLLAQDASGLSLAWILAAIYDVVQRDWPLLLAAGAALTLPPAAPEAAGAISADQRLTLARWYLLGSVTVLGATIKVGTFAPIFQFAEPILALHAALFLLSWRRRLHGLRSGAPWKARRADALAAVVLLLVLAFWSADSLRSVQATSDRSVRRVVAAIQHYSAPGSLLLAPPWYLYLAHRRSYDRYADINLWALAAARGDAAALAQVQAVVTALDHGDLPLVALDRRVARLPGVVPALHAHYRQLPFRDPLPVDRAVTLWVPAP